MRRQPGMCSVWSALEGMGGHECMRGAHVKLHLRHSVWLQMQREKALGGGGEILGKD